MIRNLLILLTLTLWGCASSGVPGGLRGLDSNDFKEVTGMVAVGNRIQARTMLASMPANLKSKAQWHYLKARNLLSMNQPAEAVIHLNTAIELAGSVPALLNDLAVALIRSGQPGQAVSLLTHLKIPGWQKNVENNLAVALLEAGRAGEALNRLRLMVQQGANDATQWFNLGLALSRTNNPDEAITSLKRAATIQPDDRDILLALANACVAGNDPTCADLNYKRVVSLYPLDIQAKVDYGVFMATRGKKQAAITMFNSALRLQPKCPICVYNLGVLNEKWGNIRQARAFYSRFLSMPNTDTKLAEKVRIHLQRLR